MSKRKPPVRYDWREMTIDELRQAFTAHVIGNTILKWHKKAAAVKSKLWSKLND